ncbi:LytR/AlgR family response regulator transcription factor [Flavobacterium sp. N1994]|uniref:LytR/AlgR family response regulator transcription factor n=1 Tax=Flavobacterium sp. N1994 TaxID=2986827 RepID=UPI0022213E61|nr:LytTR family DNA-binding domain-containing protein [Flavobacterium sp. N1994]
MITAVLIDDDINLRDGMKGLLSLYAPDISIIGEADSVESGVKILNNLKPQIVFLDIQMNDGTGFDILEKLSEINGKVTSHVIFVTAYEHYAIKAFRFSALDFLLKPVAPDDLEKVVDKIRMVLEKDNDYSHIDLLLENIRKKADNFKRIALSNSDGMHLLDINDIIRCESDDNYTKFFIKSGKPILISKTLKEYEELLSEYDFVRIHQSHLINLAYVKSYVKKENGFVVMHNDEHLPVSQRKRDLLQDVLSKKIN